ncbi:MAG TPA: glycosyltransferase family 2 protein, partial [Rhodothermales bacterium]|nr:glycosyltransferase family 2 protein [Rhodothermales bacterium]
LAHEIIVVDNASPDHSAERLRQAFPPADYPDVHVISNEQNVGFARANNQGAAIAKGKVLFFLNPDTVVYGSLIRTLHDFLLTHPAVGAVGPRVLNPDGSDQPSTSRFVTVWGILRHRLPLCTFLYFKDRRDDPIVSKTSAVEIVNGCALAIARATFDVVGGWDETYFMYSEETELCYNLAEKGYVNYYVREAEVLHYGGVSSREHYAQQQVMAARSNITFLRRHHDPALLAFSRITGIVAYGLRIFFFRAKAWFRPEAKTDYDQRRRAAAALFKWFLFEHS